jgi:hypothetical protein
MSGIYVKRLQERLSEIGLNPGPVDSSFGGGTESAIKRFQKNQQLPPTGLADSETWRRLFPGENPPVSEYAGASVADRCLALTGSFETGTQPPDCYCGITGDFDGQGISFGALQWNIGQGTLQPLLQDMFAQHQDICGDIFHEHVDTVRSMGEATKSEQIEFSRSIQTQGRIQEPWRGMLRALGRTPEFQSIQSRRAKKYYDAAIQMCSDYGLNSERAVALFFDIVVQNGSISSLVKSQIMADIKQLPAASREENEVAKMRIIANRRAAAARPQFVDDVRTRKLTIANGSGTVHGIFYDLEDRYCLSIKPFAP